MFRSMRGFAVFGSDVVEVMRMCHSEVTPRAERTGGGESHRYNLLL